MWSVASSVTNNFPGMTLLESENEWYTQQEQVGLGDCLSSVLGLVGLTIPVASFEQSSN